MPAAADDARQTARPLDQPDLAYMSVSDHLEELRTRLIRALLAVGVGFAVCLIFARSYVIPFFCRPLIDALLDADLSPQMFFTGITDPFFVYLKVSLIGGLVLGGPVALWQMWSFIAAGLYKQERRTVTRYIPLSISLFALGVSTVYYVAVPFILQFFLAWNLGIPLPNIPAEPDASATATVLVIPSYAGDPAEPVERQFWFDSVQQRFKVYHGQRVHVLTLGGDNLLAPVITLPEYLNLLLTLLIGFGLTFQLPLVVMGLVAAGVVQTKVLREKRKIIYFGLAVASAVFTPADPFSMLAMFLPLLGLYELGLWLAERRTNRPDRPRA